ncbi:MAG: response regulator [Marinobacter sp.]
MTEASQKDETLDIVVSEINPGSAEQFTRRLTDDLKGMIGVDVVGYARDGLEVVQITSHLHPDIVFIETDMAGIDGFEACKMAVAAAPETACVIVAEQINGELREKAMRSGARAIISLEDETLDLYELIKQLIETQGVKEKPEYKLATDPEKVPMAVAVTSAKGGAGKTTVASNLAVAFAKRFTDEVVLVDFFGQFGNVALSLDLEPPTTIADLLGYEDLDVDLVDGHLVKHETGLRVLAGVPRGIQENLANIDIPDLASMLGMLRRRYRFVLFDIQPLLWPATPYVLSRCQQILLLCGLDDIAAIRDTAALVGTLVNANIPKERIRLVANQVDRSNEFSVRDLEEATGMKVWAQIPKDTQVASNARNAGVPFVQDRPQAPISQVFGELVDQLLESI